MTYKIARNLRPDDLVFAYVRGKESQEARVVAVRPTTQDMQMSGRPYRRAMVALTLRFTDGSVSEQLIGECRTIEIPR